MTAMWDYLFDRSLYDHPGADVTMRRAIRRYRDRPALAEGEHVTIVRLKFLDTYYGADPRVLVRNAAGAERWIHATDADGYPTAHAIVQR